MDLFSDLRDGHYFNGTHEHKCLVRYVFLGIFQKELDEHRELWNNHTIRPVRQSLCPSGKPETMYHLPHRFVYSTFNLHEMLGCIFTCAGVFIGYQSQHD